MLLFIQALTLILVLGMAALAIILLMAAARLRPPRLTDAKALYLLGRLTPADLGFTFETLRFTVDHPTSHRPVRLAAWLVPHPQAQGRTVILIHGYSDAKIGAAAWLPMLHRQHVNILLIDLPGHGDSEPHLCTSGLHERHMVSQLIDAFQTQFPDRAGNLSMFGISMGGAIALATACLRTDIAAVMMDCPYSDFRHAVISHAWLFGLPGRIFQVPATAITEYLLNIRFADVAPILLLPQCPCPVLLIQGGDDYLISTEDAAEMRRLVSARADGLSSAIVIKDAPHILGLATDPESYENSVAEFMQVTSKAQRRSPQ